MELLSFGDTGWGDELFFATLMTIAVSIAAMAIGFIFALIFTPLKLSKNKTLNVIGNCYTTIIRGVPELLVIYLIFSKGFQNESLRSISFNVISILTGTGYVTKNFDQWGNFPLIFFLLLMFIGGCAGSTTCGIKVFRVHMLYFFLKNQLLKL